MKSYYLNSSIISKISNSEKLYFLIENDLSILNDLFTSAHEDLWSEFDLPALYLLEDGISKGDASEEDLYELVKLGLIDSIGDFSNLEEKFIYFFENRINKEFEKQKSGEEALPTCDHLGDGSEQVWEVSDEDFNKIINE